MNLFSRKLDLLTLAALTFMAISISLLNFDNLSWEENYRSYIGLVVFIVLLVIKYRIRNKSKSA